MIKIHKKIFMLSGLFIVLILIFIISQNLKNQANGVDLEPRLPFGQITREDRIKHIEWTYRNNKQYEQFALLENELKDYVATFYQPNFRNDTKGGGIMIFEIKEKQPKIIWESTEYITLTMPETLDVKDITNDKRVEIISTWSDGKVSILYLYSWNGEIFEYITPLKKSTSKYAPTNSYSPIFGISRGDIQIKDLDGDNIYEVIISGGTTRDEMGNEVPIDSETIYKWNGEEYYLWEEELVE